MSRPPTLHEQLADAHPKLKRGIVWCHTCGARLIVDPADCLRWGWPTCCGSTMGLDAPEDAIRRGRGTP